MCSARFINIFVVGALLFIITSCGSSSSSDTIKGQFKDSFVEGLKFDTPTQSGLTDSAGSFTYRKGEIVTLSLGGVVLGSTPGAELITPINLVPGAQDENNETALNIARLLQSLDLDGNPDNGITIPAAVRTEMANISLDFSTPGFGNSPAVSDLFRQLNDDNVFPQKRSLVSKEIAKAHLKQSLGLHTPDVQTPDTSTQAITDSPIYSTKPSMAFDSTGTAHVVVVGDHLYHYTRQTGGWLSETVQAPPAYTYSKDTKLVIDSTDSLHVFYRDLNNQLQYVTNRPGSWSVETVNALDATVDHDGYLHMIAYDTTTKTFTYGTNATGRWTTQAFNETTPGNENYLDTGIDMTAAVPTFLSLAIDKTGKAHLVYCKTVTDGVEVNSVLYATNASGTWQVERMYEGYSISPQAIRLALDRQGVPHVAYGYYEVIHGSQWCSGACDNRDEVLYFTKANGTWKTSTADGGDAPDGLAFSVDSKGSIYLAISNSSYPSYVTSTGSGAFVHHDLPSETRVTSTFDAALDPAQNWHLILHAQDGLRYLSLVNGTWQVETISLPKKTGLYANVASDATGSLHFSFWDAERRAVRYAYNLQGKWTTEIVSEGADVGKQTSIAVDSLGSVHIIYVDTTLSALKYAKKIAGVWTVKTVAQDSVGRPALAVDSSGSAHLTYVDWKKSMQMYATNTTGAWQITQLSSVNFYNSYANISINANDKIGLCFQKTSSSENAGVWLAQKEPNSSNWVLERVYSAEPYDSYCTVLVDSRGAPHVAYVRYETYLITNQLIYATKNNGSWSSEVVVQGMPGKLSLVQDTAGHPFMSYYDFANGTVNYTYNLGSGWATRQLAQLITYNYPEFLAPLAIDPTGRLYAAYFDHTKGDLNLMSIVNPLSDP